MEKKLCPRCGASMWIKTANQGSHKGEQFWGCSNYPACRHIINYTHPDEQEIQGTAKIGSTVTIRYLDNDETETYKIIKLYKTVEVHTGVPFKFYGKPIDRIVNQANEGEISSESPLGNALLGKCAGDTVVYSTPKGNISVSILSIE